MLAGLPKFTSKQGSIAATTRGSTGVVAWQSRYTGRDRGCRGGNGAESAGIAPSIVTRVGQGTNTREIASVAACTEISRLQLPQSSPWKTNPAKMPARQVAGAL